MYKNFVQSCLEGRFLADEIDDAIDEWHESDSSLKLHEFLGMNEMEYGYWVERPDFLRYILFARQNGIPFDDIVHQHSGQQIAARAASPEEARSLFDWLKQSGHLK